MKHKYRYRTAVILTALVLLVPVAMNIIDDDVREEEDDGESPIGNYDDAGYRDVERITEVPEGYIGIYTPEEMNLIGKDPDHPLDGKYILMADLDMTDAVPEMRYTDHSALQLKYRLYNGAFQIWIGLSSDAFYSIDGGPLKPIILSRLTTSYSNVSDYTISEDHTLTVIGRDSEYKPFAFRVTINASTISTTAKTLDPISSGIGNFVPIGTFDEPFTGMFNGNGHMISGMEIWGIDDPTGIFGYIHGATIMNLRADAEIWSADPSLLTAMISRESESCATGGIVGVAVLSTIYNCKFSGEISFLERSYHSYIGGAIGSAASSTLANLESEGIISGGIDRSSSLGVTVSIGGIVGSIKAMNQDRAMTVVGCCNRMSIEVDRISASTNGAICCGGIFGTTIQNDYCPYVLDSVNYGSINVNTNVQLRIGGIGGYAYWTNASGCANEGDISVRTSDNTAHVGGIFAQLQGSVSDSFNRGDIDIKSAATTTDVSAGGVCGMTFAAQVLKCYNEGDIVISGSIKPASGYIYSGGIIGYPSGAFSSGAYVIKDSYNAGDLHVSVDSAGYLLMMGGIAGYLSTNAKAGNSYNAGSVTKEGPVAKVEGINGVAGSVYYKPDTTPIVHITSCFTTEVPMKYFVSASAYYHENTYDTERTLSEMTGVQTFRDAGWDLKRTWTSNDGTMPVFRTSPAIDVTFDPRNGDPATTVTIESGEIPEVPDVARDGYTFGGWFRDKNGNGDEYTGGELTGDTVLYASWILKVKDVKPPEIITKTEEIVTEVEIEVVTEVEIEVVTEVEIEVEIEETIEIITTEAAEGNVDRSGYLWILAVILCMEIVLILCVFWRDKNES